MPVTIQRQTHNGVDYVKFVHSTPVNAVLTVGEKEKFKLTGSPRIVLTRGSYMYGPELQLCVLNTAGSTKKMPRVPYANKWDTMEILMTPDIYKELLLAYMEWLKAGGWANEK